MTILLFRRPLPVVPALILLLFCLFFAVAPHFDLLPMFARFNEARILELLLLVATCCCFAGHPALRAKWLDVFDTLPKPSKLLMLAVVLLGCISATQAAYPAFAGLEVALFVLLFGATLCLAVCRRELGETFDRVMLLAIIVMSLPCFTAFLSNYLFALFGEVGFERDILFENYANVRFFNQLQGWTLSLIVVPLLLYPGRPSWQKIICAIAAINWWLLLFVSGGRGTVLSALVAFPVTRLIYGAKARHWFRWQIVTALTGFVLYLVLILLLPAVLELNFNAAQIGLLGRNITYSNGRFELWTIALEMIVNSPWLGVGPMHYAANPTILYAHPHNAPLQLAAEWGIPVALLVLVLFIWGAVRWVLRSKVSAATEDDGNLRVAVFGALLTSALYSLFDGVIVMPISQIMLVLIIGWMLGLLTPQTMHCKPVARFRQLVLILSFAVVLTGVLRPLFPSVFCLEELQRKYDQANPKAPYLKTRFWQQGILTGYPKTFPCQTN